MIIELIRTETKEHHQYLEKLIVPCIKNIRSKEDYLKLLTVFYGYFTPVEARLDKQLSDTIIPNYSERRKAQFILKDIEEIYSKNFVPQFSHNIPQIENNFQAIGAMYVLEGSTLGGKMISKMLKQNLSLQNENAFSFFDGYGENSERYWQAFVQKLNDFTVDADEQKSIVKSAVETFQKFSEWVQENYPMRLDAIEM